MRLQLLPERVEQSLPDVGMGHLASPEAHGELHLVTTIEELRGGPGLGLEVVAPDLRLDPDLLEFNDVLILARVALAPALLVAELPVVHHATDWWCGIGRDLDEVHPTRSGHVEGVTCRQDAELVAFLVDDPDFANADPLINPWS